MNEPATAWSKYLESEDCRRLADPTGLGATADQRQYMENRLWKAFIAGYKAGAEDECRRVLKRFSELLGQRE